jgi:nitrogen fixation-related uncharacterized protein
MLYCVVVSVAGVTVAGVWHMWANASGQMQGEMCALHIWYPVYPTVV